MSVEKQSRPPTREVDDPYPAHRDWPGGRKQTIRKVSPTQTKRGLGGKEINSRTYVGKFNFNGASQQQKVGTLSGGQHNRVHLAKLSASEIATPTSATTPWCPSGSNTGS